jgi:hypothetical protein
MRCRKQPKTLSGIETLLHRALLARSPCRKQPKRAYLGSLLPNYVKSGNLEKYYQRLTDFNFLMTKIQHPEFGVQPLILMISICLTIPKQ